MDMKFVGRFMAEKPKLEAMFSEKHPDNYEEVVENTVAVLTYDEHGGIDPERIHKIDDGDYQGTLLFVIGAKGDQPSDYWYVKVGYGSCSGCDTLESIREYSNEKPTPEQIAQYMTLALHIVQGLKKMGDDDISET